MGRRDELTDGKTMAMQLHAMSQRVSDQVDVMLGEPGVTSDQARAFLQELSTQLEELRVAEEELTIQAEQLAASQAAIDLERERYAKLFEFAPDAYLETDSLGKILEANGATARLFGVPIRFLRGKLVQFFIAPGDVRAVRSLLSRCVESGIDTETLEVDVAPRDLPPVPAEIRLGSHFDPHAGQSGEHRVRWLIRDVTERRKLDRELRQLHADVELLAALAEVNMLVEGDDPLVPMLNGLLRLAVGTTGGHAGIALQDDRGRVDARAFSDPVADELCRLQFEGGGPAAEVLRDGRPRRACASDLAQWPALAGAAAHHGVEWVLSHPIGAGTDHPGVFSVFGSGPIEDAERSVRPVAEHAARVVANGRLFRSATQLATHLERALESRGVIEQAKGILMAWQGCDAERAFDILRRASQRENRKLRTIAEDIVEKAARGGDTRH